MQAHGLVVHAGAQHIGRQDLPAIITPEATNTHKPIPHATLVETILESLAYRQLQVVRDEYAVTGDGMRLFGFLEVNIEHGGVRLALVFRNSHDKSFSLGLLAGYRTFCCDNLAFHGEFVAIAKKHTNPNSPGWPPPFFSLLKLQPPCNARAHRPCTSQKEA
jgi:hypothetical protein